MSQQLFERMDFDNLSDEDKAILKQWNREDLIPGHGEVEPGMEEDELVYDVENLRKPALQHQARLRGLDDEGTVAELKDRIMEHDEEEEEE